MPEQKGDSIFLLLEVKLGKDRHRLATWQDKLQEFEKLLGDHILGPDEWTIQIGGPHNREHEDDHYAIHIRHRETNATPDWEQRKIIDRLSVNMTVDMDARPVTVLSWGKDWRVTFSW